MRTLLIKERTQRNLSSEQVAEKLGVSKQQIYYLETNQKNGSFPLWAKIQSFYEIPDSVIWSYIKENSPHDKRFFKQQEKKLV